MSHEPVTPGTSIGDGASVTHAACDAAIAELEGKYKRALADLANAERQHAKTREDLVKFAAADLLREVLVLGDALRAAAAQIEAVQPLEEQFDRFLAERAVEPTAHEGEEVDYTFHEVVDRVPVSGDAAQSGKILRVVQQGYRMHGRCLRTAKVIIGVERHNDDHCDVARGA